MYIKFTHALILLVVLTACSKHEAKKEIEINTTKPAGVSEISINLGETRQSPIKQTIISNSQIELGSITLYTPVQIHPIEDKFMDQSTVVSLVLVKRPWYPMDWMITRGFRKSIPTYQTINGLIQKFYVLSPDGRFGGVYFWKSKLHAEAFYDTAWSKEIVDHYGEPAQLIYWSLDLRVQG